MKDSDTAGVTRAFFEEHVKGALGVEVDGENVTRGDLFRAVTCWVSKHPRHGTQLLIHCHL